MKNNKIYIFFILFLIFFVHTNTFNVSANVFGGGANSGITKVEDDLPENQIIKNAETSGGAAAKSVAKFDNTTQFNVALGQFFKNVRWGIGLITAFGTITSFLIFSIAFLRLSTASSNAILRRKVMVDILQSGVATVLLGGLTLIMTVYYKTFEKFMNNSVFLSTDYKNAFGLALIEYKYLICGIMGILALTMFIIFIKDIVELSMTAGNPHKRAESIKGLLVTGFATIGFGGTGVFVAMFNGLLTF